MVEREMEKEEEGVKGRFWSKGGRLELGVASFGIECLKLGDEFKCFRQSCNFLLACFRQSMRVEEQASSGEGCPGDEGRGRKRLRDSQ